MTAASSVASVQPAATADERAARAKVLAEYRQERTFLGPYEAMRAVRDCAANSYMRGVKYHLSSDEAGQLADFAMWIAASVYLKAIYEREVPRRPNRRQRTLCTVAP